MGAPPLALPPAGPPLGAPPAELLPALPVQVPGLGLLPAEDPGAAPLPELVPPLPELGVPLPPALGIPLLPEFGALPAPVALAEPVPLPFEPLALGWLASTLNASVSSVALRPPQPASIAKQSAPEPSSSRNGKPRMPGNIACLRASARTIAITARGCHPPAKFHARFPLRPRKGLPGSRRRLRVRSARERPARRARSGRRRRAPRR